MTIEQYGARTAVPLITSPLDSCQAQLLAEAAGTPRLIPVESARYTREQTGHPLAGWFNFQPLWDEIARSDPDLFD